MVLSGPPTPVSGAQPIPPSLLRTNSGLVGAQGGSIPSQPAFPSLLTSRTRYNTVNVLANISNVSSLLRQSYGNGGSSSGLSGSGGSLQRGGIDMAAESDPLSDVGNGVGFTPGVFMSSNMVNPSSSGQSQGQQFLNLSGNRLVQDQQQPQEVEAQTFRQGQQSMQQFPVSHNQQQPQQEQEQQYQSIRGGLSNSVSVKLEPQMRNDVNGTQQQQLQSLLNLSQVKLEPQQLQALRNLGTVKIEPQNSEQPLFPQQQQQQQQFLHMSRQSPQAAAAAAQISLLQQQHLMQLQQHQQQQQQILKAALPQQRSQLQPQFQQQNLSLRSATKSIIYEPGMCARRLTHYMYHQRHKPADNNIEFWRKFVAEYFAPHAKKRWCVSQYGSGRQPTGIFPQDVWHCEICNQKPGRGFETTVEVLPRLCKIKYDSGTLEELLYVDMPREYQNSYGQIVLDYAKAIQESVFEQLRVVRDGQLRIVFSSDLKICSWEFCARRHEELIPRRLIIPQVNQLGAVPQKYQAAAQNASSNISTQDLQNNCNMFVASVRHLAKALEVPLVNDLGYTKRYVRCLQISEVVNSMKDLIDYSQETGTGPMASLINFPRRTTAASMPNSQGEQPEEQSMTENSYSGQNSTQTTAGQLAASTNVVSAINTLNPASTMTPSTVAGLLHQNSMNYRREKSMNNVSSPYCGTTVQIPSASSSSSQPQSQNNLSSPFPSPMRPASTNPQQTSHNALTLGSASHLNSANSSANILMQLPSQSNEAETNDCQSSVQQLIQEMMMSSQLKGGSGMVGSLGNEIKNINGISQTGHSILNGLIGNGIANSSSIGFAHMGGIGPLVASGGIRNGMSNSSFLLNGRASMSSMDPKPTMNHQQEQDLGSQLLSGLGMVNDFNNLQFDWKSP